MKKVGATLLIAGLVFGASVLPAEAKGNKKKVRRVERTVSAPYQCPCGVWNPVQPLGFWLAGGALGGAVVPTGPDDRYVQVEVVDQSGGTVLVGIAQNVDGTDNLAEVPVGEVCGTTTEPLEIPTPGINLDIFVYEGTCSDLSTPSTATSGTIELTFSNLP